MSDTQKAPSLDEVHVLVIDDERSIRSACRMILTDQGHHTETRGTGREGLEAISGSMFDVLLLDLKLPDTDGMDILREVKADRPDMCVIIMTGFSTVKTAVEAMKIGAFDYLSKPFDDDELVLAVERALKMKRLTEENLALRERLIDQSGFDNIVGEHPRMRETFEQVTRVAPTDTTVLIYGESGTGKELFARAIHTHSKRAARPFVAVDGSTLASNLLESELFGHVKGAFTGADRAKKGVFEVAEQGTLFLDDIANLSLEIQAKLLRVLEAHEYKPVGASHSRKADVRLITATNQDLQSMVDRGEFRQDLFYRLNVIPICLPPLRERKEDIAKLAYHFLRYFCRKSGKRIEGFADDALEALLDYHWPGNVRQLRNVVERLVIMTDRKVLDPSFVMDHMQARRALQTDRVPETVAELNAVKKKLLDETFGQVQRAFLARALKACHGNITEASALVGMKRSNFSASMKKHHLTADSFKS